MLPRRCSAGIQCKGDGWKEQGRAASLYKARRGEYHACTVQGCEALLFCSKDCLDIHQKGHPPQVYVRLDWLLLLRLLVARADVDVSVWLCLQGVVGAKRSLEDAGMQVGRPADALCSAVSSLGWSWLLTSSGAMPAESSHRLYNHRVVRG